MNKPNAAFLGEALAQPSALASDRQPRRAWWAVVAVMVVFAPPLAAWASFGFKSELYSYTLLIPVISAYMIGTGGTGRPLPHATCRTLALSFLAASVVLLWTGIALRLGGAPFTQVDWLALTTGAFVATAIGACIGSFTGPTQRRLLFPLGFLAFMIPLPAAALQAVETALQHGSAAVARLLLELVGTPVFYEALTFQVPGVALHVAPECSGIRSTLVLLVVSVVTGYFFLRSPWSRLALAVAIVPLALLRNGFRIFVIAELCVHGGPQMIDSALHRRGGPLFFALSLLPFFLLLFVLRRRESRRADAAPR